jgi:hypothetical protein
MGFESVRSDTSVAARDVEEFTRHMQNITDFTEMLSTMKRLLITTKNPTSIQGRK